MDAKKMFIVIPCYNEEEVIEHTAEVLGVKVKKIIEEGLVSKDSKICFVDDGSKDRTWELIEKLHQEDDIYSGIKLSRNKGHQNALMAGLMTAKYEADFTISMDADLQDDIEIIDEMISKYNNGCDIVYGVRNNRETDGFFKRFTAEGFYRFMNFMGAKVIFNHADYRLMSKKALEGLSEFKEVNLFLRGIVPLIGYKTDIVKYKRSKRYAGDSKYPLKKMLSFAFEGITSFSIKPMKIILFLGAISFICSLIMFIYTIISLCMGRVVSGWSSMMISTWCLGGLILISLGVIGEYIGKIYLETKKRPLYIIDKFINNDQVEVEMKKNQAKTKTNKEN